MGKESKGKGATAWELRALSSIVFPRVIDGVDGERSAEDIKQEIRVLVQRRSQDCKRLIHISLSKVALTIKQARRIGGKARRRAGVA